MSENGAVRAEGKLIKVPCTFEGPSLKEYLQDSLVEVRSGDQVFEGKITSVKFSNDGCIVDIVKVSPEERILEVDIESFDCQFSDEISGIHEGYITYRRSEKGVIEFVGTPRNQVERPTIVLAYLPKIEAPREFKIEGLTERPLENGMSQFWAVLIG